MEQEHYELTEEADLFIRKVAIENKNKYLHDDKVEIEQIKEDAIQLINQVFDTELSTEENIDKLFRLLYKEN